MTFPKITIVTPSFNQAKYLEKTILSIVKQEYPNLEYIIIDGGSTDGSIDIIRKYEKHLTYWESEKDNGLYDALNKGFKKSTGEIMGWLNSDDLLHQNSLFVLADIFSNVPKVKWIQGYPSVFDDRGRIVYSRPHKFSKYSFYLKEFLSDGQFIQQESTYWRRELWEKAGQQICTTYKYAGDFELWMRFFRHETLYVTNALIGGFRVRQQGQLSRDSYQEYLSEAENIIQQEIVSLNLLPTLKRLQFYRKYLANIPFVQNRFRKYASVDCPQMINYDLTLDRFTG
ncbi:glycosyltransferase family 2 protein [Xanthocytophaga agilis]|uniref:Glycosyltransferase family 2 protein n=1 Tax=Xanthocytophaga agilis TaxID=3048010 RepID=A0AAE3UDS6_9BACT|nr:glycosyltransferase family 2 protein [Xanthocytophaga agilis]MDJ1502183.1 glycosyltransferase family 2 protein [Xanthocytophaga agilis]